MKICKFKKRTNLWEQISWLLQMFYVILTQRLWVWRCLHLVLRGEANTAKMEQFGLGTSLSLSLASFLFAFYFFNFLNFLNLFARFSLLLRQKFINFTRFYGSLAITARFVILSVATNRLARRKPQQKNPHPVFSVPLSVFCVDTSLTLSMTKNSVLQGFSKPCFYHCKSYATISS